MRKIRIIYLTILFITLQIHCKAQTAKADFSLVPGTVIDHSPASSEKYIGSPSIVILPNGDYIASHDHFGPGGKRGKYHETLIFRSTDRGKSWKKLTLLEDQFWSTLFYHRGVLYIMGTKGRYVDVVIRKSTDGGNTWTNPVDENTGLLAKGPYHCAPVPVVEHNGRIWRAMEYRPDGESHQSLMMSASTEADLLKRSSWTFSNKLKVDEKWHFGKMNKWIEGNAVVTPKGKIVNIIRVSIKGEHSLAAMINVSDDGKIQSLNPEKGFIDLPGGTGKKFTIRFDTESGKYWSLVNWIQPRDLKHLRHNDAGALRNTVALVSSENMRSWTIERVILHHPDFKKHGFQYPDWVFDGNDIIAVIRTAYDDGLGGAANRHDANLMTFHRIVDFRNMCVE